MTHKKTISVIATGGTIASDEGEKGLKPTYMLNEMLNETPGINEIANIRPLQLMNKDSSDMQPEDWIRIATTVTKELEFSDGAVITHGTDTMAYTSSALSFMLKNLDKPVILTGSQRPWNEKNTDAKSNIIDAVRVAESGLEKKIKGVNIVFHGKIIKGCRARKSKYLERSELDAFETVNYPMVGIISKGHIMTNPILTSANGSNDKFTLDTKIDTRVFMLTLTPGFNPQFLNSIKDKFKGIIIQAYGLGNMPIHGKDALLPFVKELMDSGKSIAVTSQACYETDLSQYELGRRFLELGVIPTLDMTPECAYTKFMWALGHTADIEKIRKIMWKNYTGEIWPLNGHNGAKKPTDIMGEMARNHELTRVLYESNTQLMDVLGEIFEKKSILSRGLPHDPIFRELKH